MNTDACVYLDTETTGLEAGYDEVVAIAIVDADGTPLVDSLVRPEHRTSWPDAEAVNGIGPADVAGAPTLAELAPAIEAAVGGRRVVMYNADFDLDFVGHLLAGKADWHCCMIAWAEHAEVWSHYWQDLEWHKLVEAAAAVDFAWPATPHSALADALATRIVWLYLHDPAVRADIDARLEARRQEREDAWEVERILEDAAWTARRRDRERAERATRFLNRWWLRRAAVPHWTAGRQRHRVEDLYAQLFFGVSLAGLALLDRFETVYRRQKDIPGHLKPAAWYQRELRPTAAYVGRSRAWPLYDVAEKRRLNRKYRLRFTSPPPDTDTHVSGSGSWLRKRGFTNREIDQMPVVAECYNGISHVWYPVYRAPRAGATPTEPGDAA